jgi:myo-inositol-1(or 4)-monophosphatase
MEAYLKCFKYFMHTTRGLRRIGSAALDLAYVACGRFDFFFEYSLQKWDMAAGILLVTEAGGIVTDFNESDKYLDNGSIIASNTLIYPEVLKVIKPEFFIF